MNKNLVIALFSSILFGVTMKKSFTRQNNKLAIPSFNGVLVVKSAVRGRIRLSIPSLKGNSALSAHLQEQLARFDAINSVEVNETIGSLLVYYDEKAVEPALLQAAIIKLLGLDEQIGGEPKSRVTEGIKQGMDAINMAVSQKTGGIINLTALVVLIVAGVGIYKISRMPYCIPDGYTLVRWALKELL